MWKKALRWKGRTIYDFEEESMEPAGSIFLTSSRKTAEKGDSAPGRECLSAAWKIGEGRSRHPTRKATSQLQLKRRAHLLDKKKGVNRSS